MTIIDCSSEMTRFHAKKVTLQQTQQKDMRDRRDNGRTRLNNGLDTEGHPKPSEIHSQGSYAMRTMVQDPENDYDIDDGAYFAQDDLKDSLGFSLTPRAARERVCAALQSDKRLKEPAAVHNNCVRQEYPEGYHIDVPVYRIVTTKNDAGDEVKEYQLASGDNWVKSDARAVTAWYNNLVGELNQDEADGSQMRRVTKLIKKLARRKDWKDKTTSGVTISKLVVDHFVPKTDRDDEALYETLKAIEAALQRSLRVAHPVLTGTNLAEEGDPKVKFFHECLTEVLDTLAILARATCSKKEALGAWDESFDTSFFSDQYVEDETASAKAASSTPIFTVTSDARAQRNDGGRRFG